MALNIPLPFWAMCLYEMVPLVPKITKSKCLSTLQNIENAFHPMVSNVQARVNALYEKKEHIISLVCMFALIT